MVTTLQVTSVGLRTPMDDAEEIKQKYGCASANLVDDEENIEYRLLVEESHVRFPMNLDRDY